MGGSFYISWQTIVYGSIILIAAFSAWRAWRWFDDNYEIKRRHERPVKPESLGRYNEYIVTTTRALNRQHQRRT